MTTSASTDRKPSVPQDVSRSTAGDARSLRRCAVELAVHEAGDGYPRLHATSRQYALTDRETLSMTGQHR
jgi:hypothetical protein